MRFAEWISEQRRVYIGNAAATRDLRIQLRGNRSMLLFGLYLILLIGLALFAYGTSSMGGSTMDIVEAQSQLRSFYGSVMAMLGGMICLIAPGLSATTVVMERQRQSLDLVFSAPVSPKYYLVGKMISSYRYVWMLLILALPVTSVCVMLGGATWADVLITYAMFSMSGLVLTALALVISTVAPRPVSALTWTYPLVIFYTVITSYAGVASSFGASSREASFLGLMNPFTISMNSDTYMRILGVEVPNWITASVVSLLLVKLVVLAAGAAIASPSAKEGPSLRIHVLIYVAVISYLLASWVLPTARPVSGSGPSAAQYAAWIVFLMLSPLAIFESTITCFGFDGPNRFRPNGLFRLRSMFDGTPAGALPFVLALVLASAGGELVAGVVTNAPVAGMFAVYVAFIAAFWMFMWAVGRAISSTSMPLKTSRSLQFAALMLIAALPAPIIAAVTNVAGGSADGLWVLCVLRPMFSSDIPAQNSTFPLTIVFGLASLGLVLFAERNLSHSTSQRYDRSIAVA